MFDTGLDLKILIAKTVLDHGLFDLGDKTVQTHMNLLKVLLKIMGNRVIIRWEDVFETQIFQKVLHTGHP